MIEMLIEVEDENDNPPVFVPVPTASVTESSAAGRALTRVPYSASHVYTRLFRACAFILFNDINELTVKQVGERRHCEKQQPRLFS